MKMFLICSNSGTLQFKNCYPRDASFEAIITIIISIIIIIIITVFTEKSPYCKADRRSPGQ
jgi:hypothetical protein